jgi:hypothetical protein
MKENYLFICIREKLKINAQKIRIFNSLSSDALIYSAFIPPSPLSYLFIYIFSLIEYRKQYMWLTLIGLLRIHNRPQNLGTMACYYCCCCSLIESYNAFCMSVFILNT